MRAFPSRCWRRLRRGKLLSPLSNCSLTERHRSGAALAASPTDEQPMKYLLTIYASEAAESKMQPEKVGKIMQPMAPTPTR